jgi:hypothetical protein
MNFSISYVPIFASDIISRLEALETEKKEQRKKPTILLASLPTKSGLFKDLIMEQKSSILSRFSKI